MGNGKCCVPAYPRPQTWYMAFPSAQLFYL
jgi:hypothetical protein